MGHFTRGELAHCLEEVKIESDERGSEGVSLNLRWAEGSKVEGAVFSEWAQRANPLLMAKHANCDFPHHVHPPCHWMHFAESPDRPLLK